MSQQAKNFISGIIGNVLDRYDMALYGLMAAFIAPNFFPNDDQVVQLIKAYGIMAIGTFTRPIGALLFGKLAMNIGARKVMILCLTGVALTTGAMGLIPSYAEMGISATVIFVLTRIIQGLFAAGENTVAPFFIIQNSPLEKATRTSGFYNCSTMFGVILASVTAYFVSESSNPQYYWRYAFLAGFLTAIAGLYLRYFVLKSINEEELKPMPLQATLKVIFANLPKLIRVIFVNSFSYVTYTIPFVFMNSFIPLVTNISLSEMLQLNSILLVLDTSLIPIFGIIAENFNRAKFMALMSGFVAISIIPLFYFLDGAGFLYVMFVRLVVIIAGLAYLAPLQAWYYELFNGRERYILVGVGYSISEELLGKSSTAICLALWHYFKTPVAPAFYVVFVGVCATIALLTSKENSSSS